MCDKTSLSFASNVDGHPVIFFLFLSLFKFVVDADESGQVGITVLFDDPGRDVKNFLNHFGRDVISRFVFFDLVATWDQSPSQKLLIF